jgi:high affinity sulfate transporter 1
MTRNALHRTFPILDWLPRYQRSWLRLDLIAGITVWMVIVPEAMAYAGIAGVPPLIGLYTVPLPLFLYAILGSSRLLVVGPDSATALISASVVGAVVAGGAAQYLALTAALAIAVGVFFLVFGLLRMGWIANFISEPVMTGFLEGIVLVTILGQLPRLLGVTVGEGDFFPRLWAIVQQLPQAHALTMAIGVGSLALLVVLKRFAPKWPAALLTTIIAILAVSWLRLPELGVNVVGHLDTTLPTLSLPKASPSDYLALIPGALAIALLGYIETLASAEGVALKGGGEIDPDQELVALGAANVGAGLSSGFVAVGSLSKTSVAMDAGGKTQIGYVFSGILTLLTIRFLMPLLANLPDATLAAIVIVAMIGLDQTAMLRRQVRYSRLEFSLALVSFLGVLLLGVLQGVGLGVALSLLVLIWRAGHPGAAVLGRMPDGNTYRDIARRPEVRTFSGLLIFRMDAQLIFPNSRFFAASVKHFVAKSQEPVRVVVIDAETINDVDITGAETLKKLHASLARHDIALWLAQVKDPVLDKLQRMGVVDALGEDACSFESVSDAVQAFEQDYSGGEELQTASGAAKIIP